MILALAALPLVAHAAWVDYVCDVSVLYTKYGPNHFEETRESPFFVSLNTEESLASGWLFFWLNNQIGPEPVPVSVTSTEVTLQRKEPKTVHNSYESELKIHRQTGELTGYIIVYKNINFTNKDRQERYIGVCRHHTGQIYSRVGLN